MVSSENRDCEACEIWLEIGEVRICCKFIPRPENICYIYRRQNVYLLPDNCRENLSWVNIDAIIGNHNPKLSPNHGHDDFTREIPYIKDIKTRV